MQKRSSKKDCSFETLKQQNSQGNGSSPLPLRRENTLNYFRIERDVLELPKIFPIHNTLRPKRYVEINTVGDEGRLNLIGMKYHARMSKEKRLYEQSTQVLEHRGDRHSGERSDSQRQIFIEGVLMSNGIARISYESREKLKVFVEEGNNSRLVNELMRRRTGVKIVSSKKEANIVWTPFCDWQSANEVSVFSQKEERHESVAECGQAQGACLGELLRGREIKMQRLKLHNHLKNHHELSDKKCLFRNIRRYCRSQKIDEQEVIPRTYHVESNLNELPEDICEKQLTWVVKPGEDTNRGTGVSVQQGRENIIKAVRELSVTGKSVLVQEYIDPLLYRNRKFDVRCYVLVTSYCGILKAYWYREGYLRTCCREFSYDATNIYGHLTNDAVQKKHKDYGKFQQCNKLSFSDLQVLLKTKEMSYSSVILRMKELACLSVKSVQEKLRGERNVFGFQVLGYDFMIDSKGKVWLLEINTNPCLQFAGSLLSRIIWHMLENSLGIGMDPLLSGIGEGVASWRNRSEVRGQENRFQVII